MTRCAKNRRLAREAIITYYRRHARGSRVTLKEICEQYGVDYGYTRVIKVQYDRNRKRPKTNTDDPNSAPDGSIQT